MTSDPIDSLLQAAGWIEGVRIGPFDVLELEDPDDLVEAVQTLLNETRDLVEFLEDSGLVEKRGLSTLTVHTL